jgi:CRP/FNR family transcriptional regulator
LTPAIDTRADCADILRYSDYRHPVAPVCQRCIVRHINACAALDGDELHDLEAIMSHRRLDAGEMLLLEGDEIGHVFNVITGGLKLYKSMPDGRAQVVGFVLPGDFLASPFRERYAFSAEAVRTTELCLLPRDGLRRLFVRYEKLKERFLVLSYGDLAAGQEHMLLLGRMTALERVATLLLKWLKRAERIGGMTDPLFLSALRRDLADYLGLSIETVSRTFTRLATEGVIELQRADSVYVRDRARLEHIAHGD